MARKRLEDRIKIENNTKIEVYIQCKNLCAHCGRHLEFHHDMTVDHVIPLNKGGKNELENYVALCEDCNKAKSDDIVYPMDYYPYLPEKKRQEVEQVFIDYLKNTAWFAYDNLFMLDHFDLKTARAVFMPRQGYCYPVPTTMRVTKITQEEAFEYILLYIARLTPEDKNMFVTRAKDLNTPYYKIIDPQGQTIMMISAYVDQQLDKNDEEKNVLRIDFFPNPEIKYKEHTTYLSLSYILRSLVHHIHDTLMRTAKGTVMDLVFMTPHSDKLSKGTLDEYYHSWKHMCAYFDNPTDGENIENGGTIGIQMTLYQGTKKDIWELAKEYGVKSLYELRDVADTKAMQKPLDNALEDSNKPKTTKPKYTNHKNEIKKKGRKNVHKKYKR